MYKSWHFCNIYQGAEIGDGTKIGSFCEIHDVKIGKNCKIESFVFIPKLVTIEDNVFIGPHVCFTNDKYPPSGGKHWMPTLVKEGAKIGAGATILPGVTIGKNAVIGSGAVITKDVPDGETFIGNPGRKYGV